MQHHKIQWIALAAGASLAGAASGQCEPLEAQKLLASDGVASDGFGGHVSISGDTAVVGATGDDDRGAESGSAYVFEWVGGVWTQTAKLLAADGAANDLFGQSVSVSGDTAFVGAIYDDDGGYQSGSVYVFERLAGVWTQTGKLLASDAASLDQFGRSVCVIGDTALVGAHGDEDGAGAVYVFERTRGVWIETAKLRASDGASHEFFGWSVSLSGDTAVVGAAFDDDRGYLSGSAYVFESAGGAWSQVAKLTAPDGSEYDEFGGCVCVSGDIAFVGARHDGDLGTNSGSAYVFERAGGAWAQKGKLLASDGAWGDEFGSSVTISGDTALVAAPDDNDLGNDSGSVYVFERVGGVWTQTAKLLALDGAETDLFGSSVSVSGETAIVGARSDDDQGDRSGSVYVFDLCPSCPADFNGDGVVDTRDVLAFLNAWTTQDPRADFNGDGAIDTRDVLAFLNAWTAGCERE